MKLTILGCNGPYPAAGGACSGYLVEQGDTRVLLDLGGGVLGRLTALISPADLTAVILSHLHFDHMSDMLPLRYALQFLPRAERLPIYLPDAPADVRALLTDERFDLRPHADMRIGDLDVRFAPAVHPVPGSSVSLECGGKRLVYTGDTNEHDALTPFADRCDLLLADAGLTEAAWSMAAPHLSALRCGMLAAKARAGSLVLTHLAPRFDPAALLDEARRAYPSAALAKAGDVYEL